MSSQPEGLQHKFMITLLLVTFVLVIISGWFFTQVFLTFPIHLFHSFDWLFSWVQIFDVVGHWITIAIVVLVLSWFLAE